VFENHCTVTQSVRRGVDVRVQVEYQIRVPSEQQAGA
jgi:hypothetical protein